MSRVMDEMLKFFDAVGGGSGPYGWIYAMEHRKYGIKSAKFYTHKLLNCEMHHLSLIVHGEKVVIYYDHVHDLFRIDNRHTSLQYLCIDGKTLPELFEFLLIHGN